MSQKIVHISSKSRQAKYRQIINSILTSIAKGKLKRGDKVPSINDIANEFCLSRDTVMLAFNELKAKGIITSVPGIGYFVESTNVQLDQKVFLLFDEFSSFKESIYNAFIETLAERAQVDIYFHHFNLEVFETLIKDNANRYTTFVILPGNLKGIAPVLKSLPQDRIIILDQLNSEINGLYPAVYQSFEDDIFNCLESGLSLLQKYQRYILVYPGGKEPIGFLEGFRRFCMHHKLNHEVLSSIGNREIKAGEVYILPNDSDLVKIVMETKSKKMILGEDIGIISINDMPLKEVVADGITTISTDFELMGRTLAQMIIHNSKDVVKNPSKLIVRHSL